MYIIIISSKLYTECVGIIKFNSTTALARVLYFIINIMQMCKSGESESYDYKSKVNQQ